MDRLLLHGFLEGLHDLDQRELTIVLDEIRDEMPDMPQTLEAPSLPDNPGSIDRLIASGEEGQVDVLASDVSDIFLQLMRETIRIRKAIRVHQSMAPATDDAVTDNATRFSSTTSEDDEI
jgi:hypothetical protein